MKKNVTRIRITSLKDMGKNKELFMDKCLKLRHARNVGDESSVTVKLCSSCWIFSTMGME